MKDKVATVVLYLCLGGSLLAMVHLLPGDLFSTWQLGSTPQKVSTFALFLTLPVLLAACVRAFFNLRFARGLGLLAALFALAWLVWAEWRWAAWGGNAWLFLNLSDPVDAGTVPFIEWKILATALAVVTLGYCLLHLLPQRWTWRGRPLCQRTWPAFALAIGVMALWYASSVSPYRIPIIADLRYPDYRILHVERDGLQFRETSVAVWRDGRFAVVRTQRRLFQYRFPQVTSSQLLPNDAREALLAFGQSTVLRDLRGAAPARLRHWRDEGWYVSGPRAGPVGFSRGEGTAPPVSVIEVFRRLEALPAGPTRTDDGKDICLGFCYDPLAGLGIVYVNQRCRQDSYGKMHCR